MDFLSSTLYAITKNLLNITCRQKVGQKTLYLTFDDGPTPDVTNEVLNILELHNARATFFCLGKNALCYPEILSKISAKGHTIGNHAFSHIDGRKTSPSQYLHNVLLCNRIISSNLFRPPFGRIGLKQWRLLKSRYNIILWDVMSYDFASRMTPQKCAARVIKNANDGSIIVFHDTAKAATNCLGALPSVLSHFQKKGYIFSGLPAK